MFLFDGTRQHDHLACSARHERKAALRRLHVGQRPEECAKSRYFDSQPCTMRFVGKFQAECARHQHVSWHVCRPRLAKRTYECE